MYRHQLSFIHSSHALRASEYTRARLADARQAIGQASVLKIGIFSLLSSGVVVSAQKYAHAAHD